VKRNSILGLTLLLALGGLSAEGAEPQGTMSARTVESAVSAPTVVDKLVRTIRAIPGLGRLVMAGVPVTPTASPLASPIVFTIDPIDLALPNCSPLLDPTVECRVYQPVGG
jgi:hypothetical protein